MKGSLLFVYGTMLQKGRNHSRLYEAQAIFLGEAQTLDRFSLYVMERNGAPIAIRDADEGYPIKGELYAVLDEYIENIIDPMEGHPNYYRREPVEISWRDKNSAIWIMVNMYVFPHEPGERDRKVSPKARVLAYEPQEEGLRTR
jgi:gamma-glutamylcyclotransferase (GGCT)/AIG2-like uncharacterized protein YtfP